MFDRFGEMDSWQELNELAENLKEEGDLEGLRVLAAENGIYADFVDLFAEGTLFMFCDEFTAANGKLDVECADLKPQGLMQDWVEYIRGICMESPEMATAVRKKGKRLKECMAALLAYSFANRQQVDKEIVKAAKINASRVDFGVPGMREAKKLIRKYYLGEEAK